MTGGKRNKVFKNVRDRRKGSKQNRVDKHQKVRCSPNDRKITFIDRLEIKEDVSKDCSSVIKDGVKSDCLSRKFHHLPVFQKTDALVESIRTNDITIISGDTGCGKSSGVPQIILRDALLRSETAKIVVTQPRRVAASSIASRVQYTVCKDQEILKKLPPKTNLGLGGVVGYKVRFDDKISPETKISYVTDGILIREFLKLAGAGGGDLFRIPYTHIIIDEVHERSIRIDELLGICLMYLRSKKTGLKLIIMSATIEIEVLNEYFAKNAGDLLIGHEHIEGRAFPVQIKYTTHVVSDIMNAAVQTVCQVITGDTQGDILVFLPGSDDVLTLKGKLDQKLAAIEEFKQSLQPYLSDESLSVTVQIGYADVHDKRKQPKGMPEWLKQHFEILPLYASLPVSEQQRVFKEPQSSYHRKIILATNIAETSITFPNVRHVVDTGKVKLKSGVSLKVADISRAMGKQRAGRAGRVAEGTTYRLMPESVFLELPETSLPEIARCDLTDFVLDLLALDGKNRVLTRLLGESVEEPLAILNLPWPTMPESKDLECSMKFLKRILAIHGPKRVLTERG